jgi:hypothetical protein
LKTKYEKNVGAIKIFVKQMLEIRDHYKDAVNYLIRSMVVEQDSERAGIWFLDFFDNFEDVKENKWRKNMMGNNTPMTMLMIKEAARWLFGYKNLLGDNKEAAACLGNACRKEIRRWTEKAKVFNKIIEEEDRRGR